MREPIKAGDLCEVISGVLGLQSPNIGLVVEVIARQGEHTLYGVMWLCQAEFAEITQPGTRDVSGGRAHFAQDWLKKIKPPSDTKGVNITLNKELSV